MAGAAESPGNRGFLSYDSDCHGFHHPRELSEYLDLAQATLPDWKEYLAHKSKRYETCSDQWNSKIRVNGYLFDSPEEAACAIALEKYVPGYRTCDYQSFHVPARDFLTKGDCFFDFRIGDCLIEYHELRLFTSGDHVNDLDSEEEKEHLHNILQLFEDDQDAKLKFQEEFRLICKLRYRARREMLVKQNEHLEGCSVMVATTPEEFFDQVLRCFGEELPERDEFVESFYEDVEAIKAAYGTGSTVH